MVGCSSGHCLKRYWESLQKAWKDYASLAIEIGEQIQLEKHVIQED
jgi:hypothetical protein